MDERLKETIINYMREHNTMTLATTDGELPWAASVFYANDGLNLYFISEPSCRHASNIERNQKIAVTINEDYKDWREIQGIQLEGYAERMEGTVEKAKAMAIYVAKYPFVGKMLLSPQIFSTRIAKAVAKIKFYKVVPRWIRFIDNRVEFGHKEEMSLEG